MTNNCLITKLKENVNNDELIKIGSMSLKVKGRTVGGVAVSSLSFNPNNNGQTTVLTCVDGTACLSESSDGSNPISSVTRTINSPVYLLGNTPLKKFNVENKYGVQRFAVFGDIIDDFNINDFDYSLDLQYFDIQSDNQSYGVTGDVNKLMKGKSSVYGINLRNLPNVHVDVSDLGLYVPTLTTLSISDQEDINGTVEDFVESARTKSQTGSITSSYGYWKLRDGRNFFCKAGGRVLWDATTITLQTISGDIILNE